MGKNKKSSCQFLKSLDRSQTIIKLTFGDEEGYKTRFGGIASLIGISITCVFSIGMMY